jgi:hypothetical protein
LSKALPPGKVVIVDTLVVPPRRDYAMHHAASRAKKPFFY